MDQPLEEDSDSGNEYMGDIHDPSKVLPKERPPPSEPGAAKRHKPNPTSPTTVWAHATPTPYKHLVWGRVKGDGNCYWRSLGQLTNNEWPALKAAILSIVPPLVPNGRRILPLPLRNIPLTSESCPS